MSDTFAPPQTAVLPPLPASAPPALSQLFAGLVPPPPDPPVVDPLAGQGPPPRDAFRGGGPAPAAATDRAKALLAAPSALDLATALGVTDQRQQVAAGGLLARVGEHLEPHPVDASGTRGIAWNLAAVDHAANSGAITNPDLLRQYRTLLRQPSALNPEDAQALASAVASYGDTAQHFAGPDHPADGLKVTAIATAPGGASVALAPTEPKVMPAWTAAATTPVVPAEAATGKDRVRFVRTPDGLAVLGDGTPAANEQVRTMYPALTVAPGVKQYAPRRAVPVEDVAALTRRLWTTSGAGEIETLIGLPGPHCAATPGNHLVVRVDDLTVEQHVRDALGKAKVSKYPSALVQRTNGDGEVRNSSHATLAATFPDDVTPGALASAVVAAKAAGGTAPVLYTHQPMGRGYLPIQEHHFAGPAGQLVIARTAAADPDATHGYPAWVPSADAMRLNRASAPPAKTKVADPARQQDGTYLIADGTARLHFEHNFTPEVTRARLSGNLWESSVAGTRTGFFALSNPPAGVPEVSIGPTPEGAHAGLPAAAVSGRVRSDGTISHLTVPTGPGGLDLGALADAVTTLSRATGATLDPKRVTLLGPDGAHYAMNGAPK